MRECARESNARAVKSERDREAQQPETWSWLRDTGRDWRLETGDWKQDEDAGDGRDKSQARARDGTIWG